MSEVLFPSPPPARAVLRIITEVAADGTVVRCFSEPMVQAVGANGSPPPDAARVRQEHAQQQQRRHPREEVVEESHAWSKFVDRLVAGGELWHGFAGMSAPEILRAPNVLGEVRALQLMGVTDAIDHVLRVGPMRCGQVRRYVERQRQKKSVSNPAGLVAQIIRDGPPQSRRSSIA